MLQKIPFIALLLAICSCSSDNGTKSGHMSAESAHAIGRSDAANMLDRCKTTDAIRDQLLELRAREYNIRCRMGDAAADSYISGIETYLQESGDTLHDTLFR